MTEEIELEDIVIETDEFDIEIEADEISLNVDGMEPIDTSLPKIYLYIENLVMINQVKGIVEDAGELVVVPAYADKHGVPTKVGLVELTSENVLTMQLLGLKVSLIREGKEPILFNEAEHFVQIAKTLRVGDTVDIDDFGVPNSDGQLVE
ncbi:hypothetical protein [Lysinibacillus xylanilyticus]|uniref:hypothetical protein n=1 Tax=Lysinibacillus xylanilyticus TaxID=582475 RepID=UPI0036D95676